MALNTGDRLGPYEILGQAGVGGMGEVYRARDTRLDRTVAVKVLPSDRSANEEARARFDREARSLSGLTHPNICALYDVGHEGGIDFLVMEYLEGETLAERVQNGGALPTTRLLTIGAQVAEALAFAHRQGFVHRDLKPANVMLTKTGAKLLDFGLAKPLEQQDPRSGLTATPTATSPLTSASQIVGTFQYMSPEQLEGKEADARSDIFALGAVLYEITTGQRPFQGGSHASLVASIMKEDPRPLSALAPASPLALDRLVQRCLAKDPEDRWQSASDLAHGLRAMQDGADPSSVSAVALAPEVAKPSKLPWALAVLCGVAAVALAVTLAMMLGSRPGDATASASPIRFQVPPPEGAVFRPTGDEAAPVAVSPDGSMLVYGTFENDGSNRLWLRSVDEIEARPLPGTEHAMRPFWSPDNRFVGFFAEGKMKKIEVAGGPAIPLAEATEPRGGTWSPDDTIVYAPVAAAGLMQVPAAGGEAKPLTELGENEGSHRYPSFLPDGRHVVYLALTGHGATGAEAESDNRVFVASLEGGAPRQLVQGAANAQFAGGHLTYYRGGQLVARPFDPVDLKLSDDQRILASDVQYDASYERGLYSVSARTLAYHAGDFIGANVVQWFGRDGTPLKQVSDEGRTFDTQISPDGRQIAYIAADGTQSDVWVEDTQRGDRTRITFDGALKGEPQWSPDGRFLVYSAVVDDQRSIFRKNISGSGDAERLLTIDGKELFSSQWSRDGRYLMLRVTDSRGNTDLWAVRFDGEGRIDGDPFPAVQSAGFKEQWPQLSPDGRWLAYTSNESGRWEIFVTSFPEARGKWQVSPAGGVEPLWRSDGKVLFFRSSANSIMEAEVLADGDRFDVGSVESLFKVYSTAEFDGANYDVSADGQRFIVHTISEEQARAPLTVVVGW